MITSAIHRLKYLCNHIPPLLLVIPPDKFRQRPGMDKWSRQEILGHLIDSAVNNHQRFIRVQFEEMPRITYDQNQWVSLSHYNDMDMQELIMLWIGYNRYLAHIISHISAEHLSCLCNTGGEDPVTLEFLVIDYVEHMEHHLKEILGGKYEV